MVSNLKPKIIHISGADGKLCGRPAENWGERYLSDSFAQTLPTCPDCKLEYRRKYGRAFRSPLSSLGEESDFEGLPDADEPNTSGDLPMPIVEAPETKERVKTLREYLSGVVE